MTDYVQISFKGDNGIRTVWAERGTETPDGKLSFWRVKRDGDRPDPEEVIIGSPDKFTIKPAKMNLHYGELELAVDSDPANAGIMERLHALKLKGLRIDDVPLGDLERHYRRLWTEMEAENASPAVVRNLVTCGCGRTWDPEQESVPHCCHTCIAGASS